MRFCVAFLLAACATPPLTRASNDVAALRIYLEPPQVAATTFGISSEQFKERLMRRAPEIDVQLVVNPTIEVDGRLITTYQQSAFTASVSEVLEHDGTVIDRVLNQHVEHFCEPMATLFSSPKVLAFARARKPGKQGSRPKAQAGHTIAVLEFENKLPGDDARIDRVYFSDAVRGGVSHSLPGSIVMTRENTQQLLSANGKKLEDCTGECEVETGRLLGADYVVSGRLTKVGTRYKLTLRLHDTAQGALVGSATASGETVNALDDDSAEAIRQLLAPLR